MTDYFEELKKTLKLLVDNHNIFLLIPIYLLFFVIILLVGAGLAGMLFLLNGASTTPNFTPLLITVGIIELCIFLVVMIIIGGYTTALTTGFLKEIALKGSCPFSRIWDYGNQYWKTFAVYGVIRGFGMVLLPISVLALVIILAVVVDGVGKILLIILAVILGLLLFAHLLLLYFSQFFSMAMIITQNTLAVETIKKGYKYLVQKPGNVFATFGILFLVGIPVGIFEGIFSVINNIIPYVSVITVPISLFLRFCLFVFSMIYMIRCYASENNIKK